MSMMEKAMYLKGLCDGLEPDKTTKEGKLIAALLDMVTEMAAEMDDMQAEICELKDYCEELDEDLGDVEEVLLDLDDEDYDDDEDEEFDEDEIDYECDGDCAGCEFDCGYDEDDFDDEEEDEYFEVICPACGDVINFDSSIDPENLRCPNCGEKFECIVEEDDLKALDGAEE
ncbi:MAG: hypothetical protein IKU90_05990 [Clostridia bacterium]|nr:hypothetical protein [Clostridia bacterium]